MLPQQGYSTVVTLCNSQSVLSTHLLYYTMGINCMWVVQMCPEEDYSAVIEKTLVVRDNFDVQVSD